MNSLLHRKIVSNVYRKLSTVTNGPHYDVVINGGGIVGLSLLLGCVNHPILKRKKIVLLEQSPHTTVKGPSIPEGEQVPSNRVSALTSSSLQFLRQNGVHPPTHPIQSMYIWSGAFKKGMCLNPTTNPLISDYFPGLGSVNSTAVCSIGQNNLIQGLLEETISKVDSSVIRRGVKVNDIRTDASINGSCLTLESGEQISTSLLIGSDGFNSLTRKCSDLEYYEKDLKQRAIVGTFRSPSSVPFSQTAFQRFLADGTVIALLPVSESFCSFVVSTPEAKGQHLMSLSDEDFISRMNEMLNMEETVSRLPFNLSIPLVAPPSPLPWFESIVPKSRASFPLIFGSTLPKLVGKLKSNKDGKYKDVAIIGDSAHRIPPLAGQGLNLGIGDAIILLQEVTQSLERGEDLFNTKSHSGRESLTQCLLKFEQKRQLKIGPIIGTVLTAQTIWKMVPPSLIPLFNLLPSTIKGEIVKFANST